MILDQPPKLELGEFEFFREAIQRLAGITLSEAKKDLLVARLRSRVQELQLDGLKGYRKYIEGLPPENSEWQAFINLLTTNKTDWFREPSHFDHLAQVLVPAWRKEGKKRPSLWCAASSTGEEPYTLSMVMKHSLGLGADYEILATDIDTNVLAAARRGVYQRARLEQVPEVYRSHFSLGSGEISEWMKIKDEIKLHVAFGQINLLTDLPAKSKFDLISCRNVLIYFSKEVIKRVTDNLYAAAAPGATLYIGHSESLQSIQTPWKMLKPSIFVKR